MIEAELILEFLVLPIFCAHCGGAVDVQSEFDEDVDDMRIGEYACPSCEKPNVFRLPGRILWAAANPDGTSWPRIVGTESVSAA